VLQGPSGAVIGYRRRVSHGLHAILTLLIRLEPVRFGNVWVVPVASA